ncbi:P22AR C-terminal domain-containing protein [Paenibacillus wynnii]|uniref:P22AR C-terminal domain-containing protein n=1 Tax=Paenibacillus wynnii TaxID=268407 RepID=UPI0012FC42AF
MHFIHLFFCIPGFNRHIRVFSCTKYIYPYIRALQARYKCIIYIYFTDYLRVFGRVKKVCVRE